MLSGLDAWLIQRVSAAYLLVFIVFVCTHFLRDPPTTFEQWRNWVRSPIVSNATLLFFGAILLHVWVGLRDVILDYIHPPVVRLAALGTLAIGLCAMAIWIVRVVIG